MNQTRQRNRTPNGTRPPQPDDQTAMEIMTAPPPAPANTAPSFIPDLSEADKRLIALRAGNRTCVIDPRTNKWMAYWDLTMILSLFFTATVTPYEIAFVPPTAVLTEGVTGLWIINRLTDIFFLTDVFITCNTMYQMPLIAGGAWVRERRLIILNYMRSGWLVIDAVSCFPYFLIDLVLEATAGPDGNNGGNLRTLRLVKLVRMLKLTRCLKASAKVQPYLQEVMMGYLELTYAKLQVGVLFSFLVFYTHVQACFWGILSDFTNENDQPTWVQSFHDDYIANNGGSPPSPWDVYVAALYWSAMTITSIGYGEMLPLNTGERVVCSFLMLVSGMVWTYILGTAAGIAATLEPNLVLFRTTMDQLNFFMRERELPRAMRRELREFFEQARRVREVNDDAHLLESMSPLLQGAVAYAANRQWLSRIWWLRNLPSSRESTEFIATLAKALQAIAYVASERPPLGQLYVMRKGLSVKNWRFLRGGQVWGDDIIMEDRDLLDYSQAVALTYIEVFTLSYEAMDAARDRFPEAGRHIYKAALRLRTQRALLLHLCEKAGRKPRSFVPKSSASGYFFVGPQMSSEDKIDAMHDAIFAHPYGEVKKEARSAGMMRTTSAEWTDARLNQLSATVEKLASAVSGLSTMVEERLAGTDGKTRADGQRRVRQTSAVEDDEAAPLSSVEKSRPPTQVRRAATAGAVVGTVEHKTHDPPVNANARAAKAEDIAVAAAEAEHRATSSSSLPPGWQQATAPDGNVYYYQTATGVTQWAPPKLSDAELTA